MRGFCPQTRDLCILSNPVFEMQPFKLNFFDLKDSLSNTAGADTGFMLTVAPYKIITLCACAVTRLSEIIFVLSQWFLMSFPRRMVLATELRLQKLKH